MQEPQTVPVAHKIRVGQFGLCIPHYRLGVFRKLHHMTDLDWTFHATDEVAGQFLKIQHENADFRFVKVITKQMPIPLRRRNVVTLQPYAVWAMLKGSFDVYVMSGDFLRPSVWINLLLARLRRRKVCLWGQGISRPAVPLSWFLRKMIFRLAHSVVFYSEGVRQKWIDRGIPAEKMFVAYNALDTDVSEAIRAKLTESDLAQFRQKHGLAGKKIIIFCARLVRAWKRPDILLRAMKEVVGDIGDAHAVIIGDGPDRQEMEDLAGQLELDDAITFTGAIHDEELIAKYMLSSKVGVIPGNAGLGVQHCFGYGLPIITNGNLDMQTPEIELVIDGTTGLLCADGDVSSFAHAICRLLKNDDEREKMSENALKIIREKHNVERMAAGLADAVRFCVDKK